MTRSTRSPDDAPFAPVFGQDLIGSATPATSRYIDDVTGEPDFAAIQASPEFADLRRRFRAFVFPVTVLFLAWYLTYVVFSAYDHPFMSRKVLGEINIGTVFGLLEFVTTITIVIAYSRFAKKKLDPRVDRLCAEVEEGRR
jgi:uncharacterized membrane protein (DUF485 family)